jgi:hypothetical protein
MLIDMNEADGTHPDNSEADRLAQRWWAAISGGVYGNSPRRGPRITNVYMKTSTLAVITFDQDLWANSPTTTAFRVTDGGTPITVDFADLGPGDNQVQLTLHSAVSGAVLVSIASGNDATGSTLPIIPAIIVPGGSQLFLPAEPEADRAPQTSVNKI